MATRSEMTMRIHGLQHQRDAVDARIFAIKLSTLVRALKHTDKLIHGKNRFEYVLADLGMGSATARIREQQAHVKYTPEGSSVELFHRTLRAVYEQNIQAVNGAAPLLINVCHIAKGAEKRFSYIELYIDDAPEDAVRIDKFFYNQATTMCAELTGNRPVETTKLYRGLSFASFDGTLKAVDLRGLAPEAKLILTAGGKEIDCIANQVDVPDLRENLDRRTIVDGIAHYDGKNALPVRFDIKRIKAVKRTADISRWRGTVNIPDDSDGW